MMTEAEALETLAREDPAVASDARAALRWLTSGGGLEVISQLRLQEFLWHVLPTGWPLSATGQLAVARALGRLLELAGLDRYAATCTGTETEQIIAAYDASLADGVAASERAAEASRVAPPDTDLLAWGSARGPQEQAAYEACAAAIELAITVGELKPGASGWKTKRSTLVDRWLTTPGSANGAWPAWPVTTAGPGQGGYPGDDHYPDLGDIPEPPHGWSGDAGEDAYPGSEPDPEASSDASSDTLLGQISAERIEDWTHGHPGDRSRMARRIVPRLLEPPVLPGEPLPTLRWLLRHADAGLPLTARHYIAPQVAAEAADMFGWGDATGKRRQELAVGPLRILRCLAQREMGALRRSGTSLLLTRTGRLMADDPGIRWHIGTSALIGPDDGPDPDFAVAVREAALLVLTLSESAVSYAELISRLAGLHAAEGWTSRSGTISRVALEGAIAAEVHGLGQRLSALHLLDPSGAAGELALTRTGIAAALSALLSRALRPRC
jgi:hypothetical protein